MNTLNRQAARGRIAVATSEQDGVYWRRTSQVMPEYDTQKDCETFRMMSKRTIRIRDEGGWRRRRTYVCGTATVLQFSRSSTRTDLAKSRIYVGNHTVYRKHDLSAPLLLPNFQVRRHTQEIPVVTCQ